MLVLVTLVRIKRCLVWVIFHSIFNMLCISFNGCTNCLMFLVAFNNVPGLLIACTILLWWLQRWINVKYFYFKKLSAYLIGWVVALGQCGFRWLPGCVSLCPPSGALTWSEELCSARAVWYQSSLQRSPAVRTRGTTAWGENPVRKAHLHHCDWK